METCATCEGKGVYDSYDGDGRAFEFECYICNGTGKAARPTADLGEDGELERALAQSALTLEEMAKVLRGVGRSGCADIADAQAKRAREALEKMGPPSRASGGGEATRDGPL